MSRSDAGAAGAEEVADAIVRRAPFSDNPDVGARGQRTQQRIVVAALQVFGEVGYHQTSVGRITKVAGCSRVSFYQYFSSKEDLFRALTGQVARQLAASTEALGTVGPTVEGWQALRAWVGRHGEVYARYEPVFHAFQAAAESDEAVAGGSARTIRRNGERMRSRLATEDLPPRQLDPLIELLTACVTSTEETAGLLRSTAPEAYPADRVGDAVTDVFHRALFGLRPGVNVHGPAPDRPPALAFGPGLRAIAADRSDGEDLTAAGRRTLAALLEAGEEVFVRRGYHRARVDDIVTEAGLSHGAFYRYFANKDELAHVVAFRSMQGISRAFLEIPDAFPTDGDDAKHTALRSWLRRYNQASTAATAMIRVWVDATRQDPELHRESAAVIDWGRRRLARFLRPRGFGDPDLEAVVLLALLTSFGARDQPPAAVDAAAHTIERGFLGR